MLVMMPKSSPMRCTILALVAVAYKRKQHKNTLQKAPVWSRPNTLRRLSQKCFYNSRVLERSQSRVPFYEEDVGAFYSSEVLPPFLVEQVSSLQSKSHPCRASLLESETWWASLGLRSVRGPTQRMGSAFFGPVDMGLLGSPSFISYFILFSCPLHPIWSVAFVQTVNWGDGQNKQ